MTFPLGIPVTAAQLAASGPQQLTSITLTSALTAVPLGPFSAAYPYLEVRWRAATTTAGPFDLLMQIDGIAASDYLWAKDEAVNGAAGGGHSSALTTSMKIGVVSGATANFFGSGTVDVAGWSASTGFLTCSGNYGNFSSAGADWAGSIAGLFNQAGPHSTLQIFPSGGASLAIGSTFSVYGMP